MAEGSGYGGFSGVPYPYWLSPPSSHQPASAPPFLTSYPVESYDPTQGGFDPLVSNGSYQRSPLGWSNSRLGNFGPRAEDSYKDLFPPSGFYSSRESSVDVVTLPGENFSERQHLNFVPINSTTSASVPSLAEMMFYKPTEPSGVYTSSNTFDELPGHCRPGYVNVLESMNGVPRPPVEPYTCVTDSIPTLLMSSLKTEALLSQTGSHSGEGRSFPSNNDVCSHAPETLIRGQSSIYGSSVEPVNFDVLLGYNEATGHLSENPDLRFQITDSPGSRSPRYSHPLQLNKPPGSLFKDKLEGSGVSSLYQRPYTLVADSANGVSESSLTNKIEDLNCDEHRSWNHSTVSSAPMMFSMGTESCFAMNSGNGDSQAVNCKAAFERSSNQRSEDGEANQKPRKFHEERSDKVNRDYKTTLFTDLGFNGSCRSDEDDVSTGRSPQKDLCDQGDFPSPTSSTRVSSVVNAMHNLSEVLVYECFNNRSCLKLEQLENLDKVVDNLTKCLKKLNGNWTLAGEASLPTQAMRVSCPDVVNLSEAPKEIAKDFQGFSVKPLDCSGFKEPVDKNEMTQSIKNILASNFPDGEENNPQTLLYKNLWLETEATLFSTTCMARYHRIKNEIGSLKLHNREISADASIMQEPSHNPNKSVPLMNNAKQETTESAIKQGSNSGNDLETTSYDAPQGSTFNSDQVDALLSLLSRSFTGGFEQTIHKNFKPDAATSVKIPDAIHQEFPTSITENDPNVVVDWFQHLKDQETNQKLKSENCPDDVIDRFQILKQQEIKRKLKSQNCLGTKVKDLQNNPEVKDLNNNPEDSEMNIFGKSSQVSDVMDRFQILKRREAEQVQKSLSSVETDSDADNDQPRSNSPMKLASMIKELNEFHPQIERCVDVEPSASGNGCESPTSDWEHVLKDV